MKKIITTVLIIIVVSTLSSCRQHYLGEYNKEHALIPSIDFMQLWAFESYTKSMFEEHFNELKSFQIDTVIIQSTCTFDQGVMKKNYYHEQLIDIIMKAADQCNMKIILGLSHDDYWWKYDTHYYNSDTIEMFIQNDLKVFNDLAKRYNPAGWYFSNEMYSNDAEYEISWSKIINAILEEINEKTPEIPLYISPFISSAFRITSNLLEKGWTNFFKNTNLRAIDVFMPQDYYGSALLKLNKDEAMKINKYNSVIANACKEHSKAKFYLNLELFGQGGLATMDRIKQQISYASTIAEKTACFSISHYYLLKEENGLGAAYKETFL